MRAKNEETKNRIYEYINEYIKMHRVSPTINEIAKNANCAVSTAYKFLERLQDEGLIDMAGRGRITSTVNNWEIGYAPILGMVACGKPKLAVEDIQGYLPLNMDYFGKGEYFLLVASGESMINASIDDGDLVLVRRQRTCENGQIAVVLTESDCSDESKMMCHRRNWKYVGVWERSPEKKRLHFHGLFYIPDGAMVGELIEVHDYSPIKKKVQHTIQNTYFNERFGRSDFKPVEDRRMLGEAVAYLTKYMEKTGEKIVYSKGLPQYFISDILDEDVVCTIGQEDRKLLLYDNFNCWDEGCLVGPVSKEVIAQMRKSN